MERGYEGVEVVDEEFSREVKAMGSDSGGVLWKTWCKKVVAWFLGDLEQLA